jgi:hypothetical protein
VPLRARLRIFDAAVARGNAHSDEIYALTTRIPQRHKASVSGPFTTSPALVQHVLHRLCAENLQHGLDVMVGLRNYESLACLFQSLCCLTPRGGEIVFQAERVRNTEVADALVQSVTGQPPISTHTLFYDNATGPQYVPVLSDNMHTGADGTMFTMVHDNSNTFDFHRFLVDSVFPGLCLTVMDFAKTFPIPQPLF